MTRKAQAEMALILGLAVIAIIVAAYAYSSFTTPFSDTSAISEEQRSVDVYVRDAILAAAMKTLQKMYGQGGYYDTSTALDTLDYINLEIAYWQVCDTVEPPDIEEELEKGIEDYLRRKLPEKTDIAGRQVEFSLGDNDIDVGASVFENKISLTVTLPTKVDGVPLPQPFAFEIESKLGRIYDFAVDFSNYQKKYRVLDHNLLRHINVSNPNEDEEGTCWLPTGGMYMDGTLSRDWSRIQQCMEMQIEHTLAYTFEWEKPWLRADGELPPQLMSNAYIFQIEKSDGSWGQYADLELSFLYGGDEKHLTKTDPEFYLMTDPSPLLFRPEGIPGVISFTPYDVTYDVSFPVVISVNDMILHKNFRFVNFVNIKDSYPSNKHCMEPEPPDPVTQMCIDSAGEQMALTVTDTDGTPLPGVYVQFGPCKFLQTTNVNGVLDVPTPQLSGAKVLSLGHGEMEYNVSATSGELIAGKAVKMPVYETYDVMFYAANIYPGSITLTTAQTSQPQQKMDVRFVMKTDDNPAMEPLMFDHNNRIPDDIDFGDIDPDNPPTQEELEVVLNIREGVRMPANYTYSVELDVRDGMQFADDDFELDKNADRIYIYTPIIHSGQTLQPHEVVNYMKNCGFSIVSHKSPTEIKQGGLCPIT
jgi:hypothetical protein